MKFTKKPDYYNRNNTNSNFNNLPNLQNNPLQFNPISFNSKPVVSKPMVSKPAAFKPVTFKPVVSKPVNTKANNSNISEKQNKNVTLEKFILNNKITHVRTSHSLKQFVKRFLEKYKLNLYDHTKHSNSNTIFFGFYDNSDLINIKNHKGKAFLMFGGTDLSEHFSRIPIYQRNLQFICISNDIQKRLVNALKVKTKSANINSLIRKIWNVEMNMVDKKIFKPVNKIRTKIYVYDGYIDKPQNRKIYNTDIVEQVKKHFPKIEFIHSSKIKANYEKMPSIYADCFIGLRLTNNDGNANTVQELEAMNIPVVHNHSDYGLKWKTVADIVNHINENNYIKKIFKNFVKYNFYTLNNIDSNVLSNVEKNIEIFNQVISQYKKILFICTDYPGFGGAATNCYELQQYYEKKGHNCYGFYYNYDKNNKHNVTKSNYQVGNINNLSKLSFKPDLIIVKSFITYNLQQRFNCPIFYLVGGIYLNSLDKYYYDIKKPEQNKYVNKYVLEQINNSTYTFVNSSHTQNLLKRDYNIDSHLFYSSFVPFLNKTITNSSESEFENRKYDYGLIVSDFNRPIKNIQKSIDYLKNKEEKEKIVLIGKNSHKYKSHGFECIDLVEHNKIEQYYKDIKCIVQDSFYESCSNVKIEALINGCKINLNYENYNVVVSSTQYPGYGGAATNAYQIIKFLRKNGINTVGVFFHNHLDVNCDPESIGGIFLYLLNNYKADKVRSDVKSYLNAEPNYCLAKNYIAPYVCKYIFNCYTVYLVSGINHFRYYIGKSSEDFLNKDFSIDFKLPEEIKCNTLCDKIVINSKLSYDIFNKIYPTFKNKIYPSIVDTTSCINIQSNFINNSKEFDIVIACSRLDRIDKNNLFLIDILKNSNFDKYKKIIIGSNFDKFIDIPNTQCVGLCKQIQCIEYMSKSKVLLFPSLFDANSNTIREAIYHKCLPLITKNIGFYEIFPDFLICKSYTNKEWSSKLLYILENYSNLKDTQFNFNTGENIIDLIKKN